MFRALRNNLGNEVKNTVTELDNLLEKMEELMVKPTSWAAEGNRILKMEMKANETCMDYICQVEMTTLPWNKDIIKILITSAKYAASSTLLWLVPTSAD